MAFYIEKEKLYLQRDVSVVGLGANLLQVRDGIQFPRSEAPDNAVLLIIALVSKSLTSAETCYTNTEREALGILHDLENLTTPADGSNF